MEALRRASETARLISLDKKKFETDSFKDVGLPQLLNNDKSTDPTQRAMQKAAAGKVMRALNKQEQIVMIRYHMDGLKDESDRLQSSIYPNRAFPRSTGTMIERLKETFGDRRDELALD